MPRGHEGDLARSPLSLAFERVDNLGAYRIPPEAGILIPSGFASNVCYPDVMILDQNISTLDREVFEKSKCRFGD
jgi:hypothetical protein